VHQPQALDFADASAQCTKFKFGALPDATWLGPQRASGI